MKPLKYILAATVLSLSLFGAYKTFLWINTPSPIQITIQQNTPQIPATVKSDTTNLSKNTFSSDEFQSDEEPKEALDFWEATHLIPDSDVDVKTLTTTAKLAKAFKGLYLYYMPKIYVERFPDDFPQQGNPELFIKVMMSLILHENNMIVKERDFLLAMDARLKANEEMSEQEMAYFNTLIQKYGLTKEKLIRPQLDALLLRVDIIPPSLAVAMSGVQTNWGKHSLQAPFGQKEWINGQYTAKNYNTLGEAVHAYMLEMNSLPIYKTFWISRKTNKNLSGSLGEKLINTADNFMRDNPAYKKQLNDAFNKMYLQIMDTAVLYE